MTRAEPGFAEVNTVSGAAAAPSGKAAVVGRSLPLYWICQIGGWAALWLAEVVNIPDSDGVVVYPWPLFLQHAVFYTSALLLTHGWRSFLRRRQWTQGALSTWWWKALSGAFVLAVIHNALTSTVLLPPLLHEQVPKASILLVLATYGLVAWIEFTAWTGLYLGYASMRQLEVLRVHHAEAEAARREAQLDALRAQVNPHFLFNSLNTIRALISENPERARDAVSQLAQLLRASLDTQALPLVPLSREMETVAAFLALEQTRYEQRLRIEVAIEPEAAACVVPPFVVQTLVENAIKHGIEALPAGGTVRIEAARGAGGELCVRVSNPGRIVATARRGHGLENASERLQRMGGPRASLQLEECFGIVTATMNFPQSAKLE